MWRRATENSCGLKQHLVPDGSSSKQVKRNPELEESLLGEAYCPEDVQINTMRLSMGTY